MIISLLRFVIGRTRRASEILRPYLLDIELRDALAHCFQNIFERWRFALDPSQRIDASYNKRSQIRAHQSALFQLLDYGTDFFLKFEDHGGPLLVLLKRRAQGFIAKVLKAAKNGMVSTTAEPRDSFVADSQSDVCSLIKIEGESGFGPRAILVDQATVDPYHF